MAKPTVPRDGSIIIADATGTPLTMTVAYEDGDASFPEMSHLQREVTEFKSREETYALRYGARKSGEFSFTAHITDQGLHHATDARLTDAALKRGYWASATSTSASKGNEVMTYKVTWTDGTTSIVLNHVHLKVQPAEGTPGTLKVGGTVYFFADADVTALVS